MTVDRHDSGCRTKMRMPPGVDGSASFAGDRDEHRLVLRRWWEEGLPDTRFVLWAGLNPSGAEGDVDDLTIRKECHWTRLLGFSSYTKVNAATYRWTNSMTLTNRSEAIRHEGNLKMVGDLARKADVVVVATGVPPSGMEAFTVEMIAVLATYASKLTCLGMTKTGWTKHSSRLGYATAFEDYVFRV